MEFMTLKHAHLEMDFKDYITYTTGNNYYDFDDEDDRLSEVRTFLTQVLPKDNIREYIMTVFGSCVIGKTYEKFFIFR